MVKIYFFGDSLNTENGGVKPWTQLIPAQINAEHSKIYAQGGSKSEVHPKSRSRS